MGDPSILADRNAGKSRFFYALLVVFANLVLGFDLVSIYVPGLAAAPVLASGTLTWGILGAYLLVLLIVITAVYYAFRSPADTEPANEAEKNSHSGDREA